MIRMQEPNRNWYLMQCVGMANQWAAFILWWGQTGGMR